MPVTAALLLIAAGQAVPDTFYNRPGARPVEIATALRQCRTIGTGPNTGTTALGPALGPPVTGIAPAGDPIEDCMVLRGWRLFALDATARKRLTSLAPAARDRAIDRLAGARRPANSRLIREDRRLLLRPR